MSRTVAVWEKPAADHLVESWRKEQGDRVRTWTVLKGGFAVRVGLPDCEVMFLLPAVDGKIPTFDGTAVTFDVHFNGGLTKLLCFGRVPVTCPYWDKLTRMAAAELGKARKPESADLDPDVAATLQRGASLTPEAPPLPAPKDVPSDKLWCGHDGPPSWDGRTWVCAVCEREYVIEPGPPAAVPALMPPSRVPAHLGTTET